MVLNIPLNVQSLEDFEKTQEELALVKAMDRGVSELDAGEGLAAAEVHPRYGLKLEEISING